jgi:hypothetical protein
MNIQEIIQQKLQQNKAEVEKSDAFIEVKIDEYDVIKLRSIIKKYGEPKVRCYDFDSKMNLVINVIRTLVAKDQREVSPILLDKLIDALGHPTYFSRKENVLVDAKPIQLEKFNELLKLLAVELEVTSCGYLSKEDVERAYKKAEDKALSDYESYETLKEVHNV